MINKALLLLVFLATSCSVPAQKGGREQIDFDMNWHFHLGKAENAYQKNYDDGDWRILNLPHDWSIEGRYDKENPAGARGAFLPAGLGWYRKNFQYKPDWKGKKVFILFDGAYMNSTVYINGEKLGTRPNGYIGFQYDLTNYLSPGKNIISVKVDNSNVPSGRWYTGSGIYRHVKLLVTNPTHFVRHGVQVQSEVKNKNDVTASIVSTLTNGKSTSKTLTIEQVLKDKNGKTVKKLDSEKIKVAGETKIDQKLTLNNAMLWSAKTPENRYTLQTRALDNQGNVIDEVTDQLGFRKIEVSAVKGLRINGEKTIIKGICMHQDAGPVGVAVPEDVLRRRLRLLKKMGCNAIRTSHNPFAPEFYQLCDQMGFYVMDEAFDGWSKPKAKYDYGNYFDKWWQKDLREFVKRDINHPSVIFWSIGNEVRGFTNKKQHELVNFIKNIDATRPVTQGEGSDGDALDIAGMNGRGEFKHAIANYHKKHPNLPIIGTEITHTYQTRGVYRSQTLYRRRDFPAPWERGKDWKGYKNRVFKIPDLAPKEVFPEYKFPYQSSYDNSVVRMGVRDYWRVTKDKPYFLGAFRWTGFDYLGESFGWPARTAPFGIMDLAGFPTGNYYLYQSIWSNKPMVHVLPHWTFPRKKGVKIPVVVYTNTGGAELFLNGKSLGKKKLKGDALQLVWHVPYAPGKLKAVATTKTGKTISYVHQTAGKPVQLKVKNTKNKISYGKQGVAQLAISIVDNHEVEVPDADTKLHVKVEGGGQLIGLENGDILDLTPAKSPARQAFHGKLLALVQATRKPGDITVKISGEGLKPATVKIERLP